MNLKKLGHAGLKTLGAASCGLGSAGALYMADLAILPEVKASLLAVGLGIGGTSLVLAAGAAADTVAAFKSDEDDEE